MKTTENPYLDYHGAIPNDQAWTDGYRAAIRDAVAIMSILPGESVTVPAELRDLWIASVSTIDRGRDWIVTLVGLGELGLGEPGRPKG